MRTVISITLILVLLPGALFAGIPADDVKAQLQGVPVDARLLVILNRNDEPLRGKLVSTSDTGFVLRVGKHERQISYGDAKSVKRIGPPHTGRNIAIAIGSVFVGLLIVWNVIMRDS
jgi:hypothetical protein